MTFADDVSAPRKLPPPLPKNITPLKEIKPIVVRNDDDSKRKAVSSLVMTQPSDNSSDSEDIYDSDGMANPDPKPRQFVKSVDQRQLALALVQIQEQNKILLNAVGLTVDKPIDLTDVCR